MVASRVAPLWPPWIRLPGSTLRSEMRPLSGAVTSVHSRLSWALRRAASAALSCALATARFDLRVSLSASVMVREPISAAPRLDLQVGELDLRLVARHVGRRRFDGDLVGPLVDGEQRIARIDPLAVLEMQLVDEARDAGADLDDGDRVEAAGILVPLGDPLGDRLGNGHRHGRWRPPCAQAGAATSSRPATRARRRIGYTIRELPQPTLRREGADVVALQQTVNWSRLPRGRGFLGR